MNVALVTNFGTIVIELNAEKAPNTVKNFLDYVKSDFYCGTLFHRVIAGFMIQGGGFEPGLNLKNANGQIKNEANNGLHNVKYAVAMARTPAPHSASCQFFINVNDNNFLDYPGSDGWGYCVFGKVVEGTDVVDKITGVRTARTGMYADVPVDDVIIERVEVLGQLVEEAPESVQLITMPISTITRTGNSNPSEYRLAKTQDGELILQGLFTWQEIDTATRNCVGGDSEWRDIPTFDLPR